MYRIIISIIFIGTFITFGLYKNIIKLPGKNIVIYEFIQDVSDDKKLVEYYDNIFVIKILKNNGSIKNLATSFDAEVLYNVKGKAENIIKVVQLGGYEWGKLIIQEWDRLMEVGEVYLVASNYNEETEYYTISGQKNGKHLLESEGLDKIKDNSKVKVFEGILDDINFKGNEYYSEKQGFYYKKVIAEEKEFHFWKTLEKNDFLHKESESINIKTVVGERPICKGMPNKQSCVKEGYGYIVDSFIIGTFTYDVVVDFENRDKYYIFKQGGLIFEDTIEMVGAYSSKRFYKLDNKLLLIYTKQGVNNKPLYNVFYDGVNINNKYGFDNIDGYFIYKGKEGFIVDKTKIFFDDKILPLRFNYIQNRACCATPKLFSVYNNGALILANKKGETYENIEYELIELDLDDFIENEYLGYRYSKGNLRINYSQFIEKMDNNLVDDLIEKIKKDDEVIDLIISIANINGDKFDLINKLISSIDFKYYDYKFDSYSDKSNFIFNILKEKDKVIELNLHFNDVLLGNNTLIKTLANIKKLNKKTWSYFWITGEEKFMNSYKMTREEINIIHSMDLYGVYLKVFIEDNDELDKEIESFILSPKFAEYTIFKKFRKGTGLSGIYKTLDSGEEIKIADDNERL